MMIALQKANYAENAKAILLGVVTFAVASFMLAHIGANVGLQLDVTLHSENYGVIGGFLLWALTGYFFHFVIGRTSPDDDLFTSIFLSWVVAFLLLSSVHLVVVSINWVANWSISNKATQEPKFTVGDVVRIRITQAHAMVLRSTCEEKSCDYWVRVYGGDGKGYQQEYMHEMELAHE